jgi:Zn-dependent metalloprotease
MAQVRIVVLLSSLAVIASATLASAQSDTAQQARENALRRLQAAAGGAVLVSDHKATGAARFISVARGSGRSLGFGPASTAGQKERQSTAFFREYGALLGVTDSNSMRLASTWTDALGETHLAWKQFHRGVPVFAATLNTHFDASHQLKAVTGTAIPDISVSPTPAWSADRAAQVARSAVIAERGDSDALRIARTTLYVYREGLAQGIPGESHLAWEVEVTDGAGIRDMVYVGAHSGKVIDRISAVHDDLFRRAYDGKSLPFVPPNYPNGVYWLEGQPLPTLSQEANNMLVASSETYNLFKQAFGRDSFDGKGATMDAIFDRGYACPNASWNGIFISFCPGLTTDDVTAHEWGHAFTQYTHGLIYAWQSGALNEAYSDIWGEVIDRINSRGSDAPGGPRAAASCSAFSPPVGQLLVNAPPAIAGEYFAQAALFGPPLTSPVTADVVAALDAATAEGPATLDGCTEITNAAAVSGRIALVNRGGCEFSRKVLNVQQAGAIGAIIANNLATGLPGMGPGVDAALVTIPSIGVQQATGTAIRGQLAAGATVNATLRAKAGTDSSYRWLIGEDISAEGFTGALRDMWNPTCYANPGKVSDTAFYACGTGDGGGVHTNSGVPNHAFALLVDGGVYNGQTVSAIGLTKAAHIYFRAQRAYQVADSDFADHADALELSCSDLVNQPLNALTGGPSNETITDADCAQVANAIAAVELRQPPTFCNFAPLLSPALPALCSGTTTTGAVQPVQFFDFETDPAVWTASRSGTSSDFTPRDWTWVSALPTPRAGSGFFAPNPNIGTCAPGGDETGVLHLTSPEIELPATADFARATFDHWVATEPGFDGENLQISVNGGGWQLVPPSEFTFNNYNAFLVSAGNGNTNPLAGQPAWTGNNNGTVNGGSWGRTHLNLANFARAGDRIRLRWNLGSDGCAGATGVYLDNVNVYSCTPRVPSISVADVAFEEGDAGEKQVSFTVLLSTPTINAVSVNYELVEGTAQHGNDFDRISGTLVIPASTATQLFGGARIFVNIKGDIAPEGNETFLLRLTGAVNATISDGEATATIVDDDTTPPGPPQE